MSQEYLLANSHDIIQEPLPHVCYGKNRTRHASVSDFVFSGIHHSWGGFENEVRKNFLAQQWGDSIISVRRSRPDPIDLSNEMFLVGNELSLSGRFVQQVLHLMTAAGQDLRIPIRLGITKQSTPLRESVVSKNSVDKAQ